jgi:hypothetical protein
MVYMSAIATLIETVIRDRLGNRAVEHVRVEPDRDFDGDSIFRVTVVLSDEDERNLDARRALGTTRHIRHKLIEANETGFPILSFVAKSEMPDMRPEAA